MPKKVTFNVSNFIDQFKEMKKHGVLDVSYRYDYKVLKTNRDSYIKRLNGIYNSLLKESKVDYYKGFGAFIEKNKV